MSNYDAFGMRKIETIWHYVLNSALQGSYKHTQQDLAAKFQYSSSTVNYALDVPAQMGAIRKTSKFFILEDFDKLLYYWASVRSFEKDIEYATYYPCSITKAEGEIPAGGIYAGYSAAKILLGEAPADYSKLYCYHSSVEDFKKRFPENKERDPSIFVLKKPENMQGSTTTLPQAFVDIWNMRDWYSKDFTRLLEEKMHGILS